MKNRFLRRVALVLLGLLAFAQVNVALASSCPMDRGMLAAVVGATQGESCGDCGAAMSAFGALYANRCVMHCTADLQLGGQAAALVRPPALVPVLVVEQAVSEAPPPQYLAPPRRDPPRRILLHSFLI